MKFTQLLVLLILSTSCATAQPIQKTIDSKVARVTVFPAGAQVTRTAHATVPAGRTDLIFSGISPYLNPASIRVDGGGSFTILSVSPVANRLKDQTKRKDIEVLEKSKEGFQKQLIQHQASLEVYTTEEQMLTANNVVGGANTGLKAADLAAALDLHRSRMRELKFFEIDYNEKIKKTQDTLARIDQQIAALNGSSDLSTTDIIVTVQSKESNTSDFVISYVVSNAGWYPSYDLHVDDISKPLALNYKANVHQNTGEEWKDVKIAFSNGNPNESGVAPILAPLYLRNLLINAGYSLNINGGRTEETQYIVNGQRKMSPAYLNEQDKSNITYTPPSQNATSITFELATPYTVINDGQNRAVDMKEEDIPASFEYFCVPKKEKKAYLVAHIPNWLDYNLMDGEVNLYYEGTFTGKTAFSLANAEDTLNLSLGQDKGITVNRVQVKDYSKRQILSDKKSATSVYEITVRNNKKFPVNIVVEDQVPLTTEKDITIDDAQYEGGTIDEATGKVTWKLALLAGKDKKLKLSYTVKYPKNYRIQLD
ncbi:MAG: hypothetical protein JWO03_3090 [Bacteroidetes bacterium]|nr:hypothetical protein [Bacteroidota bacterium]